ncbi:MAG: hypothetical protein JOZ42_01030 [Acetobacteraceae bacterium]|nr:hypothetical protein [Acetobacteraceae bacterium]
MYPPRPAILANGRSKPTARTQAGERRRARRISVNGRASLIPAMLVAALALLAGSPARGADGTGADPLAGIFARGKPVICQDQTYALCAGASCFVFNDVAYCTCGVRNGNSISSPFNYDDNRNICSLNAEGANNGYMASTFSLPDGLKAPSGDQALYVCPRSSRANYAKCDGGICFTSTTGRTFPGADTPLGNDQIVCSCPIERANPIQGLEIIGPYPCQEAFFDNCDRAVATRNTGSRLYDGTSIGSTITGTFLLNGYVPPLNTCR